MDTFTVKLSEGGSGTMDGSFYDTGNSTTDPKKVVPETALWDLVDRNGETINSRKDVKIFGELGPILEDYEIILSCADLLIAVEGEDDIYLTIHGTYIENGETKCMTKQGKILIDEVIGIGVK